MLNVSAGLPPYAVRLMRRHALLIAALTAALSAPAVASAQFPIAPFGSEGLSVYVTGNSPIIATYLGNSAAYSNDLFLMLLGNGQPGNDGDYTNDLFIFNNHVSPVGSSVNLGSFAAGTELIFRLHVNNTGDDWLTGPASRNNDGKPHARVQSNWQPNTTLVSFEDLRDTPEYPNGYNDLSFSFTNTVAQNVVPEPASVALVGAGLFALLGLSRRRR